jgi:hypothetical protein
MYGIAVNIVCSLGMQSQAFRPDSYKTLTQTIFKQCGTPYFYKHAMIKPWKPRQHRYYWLRMIRISALLGKVSSISVNEVRRLEVSSSVWL